MHGNEFHVRLLRQLKIPSDRSPTSLAVGNKEQIMVVTNFLTTTAAAGSPGSPLEFDELDEVYLRRCNKTDS